MWLAPLFGMRLGELALHQERLQVLCAGGHILHVIQYWPALREEGPCLHHRDLESILTFPVVANAGTRVMSANVEVNGFLQVLESVQPMSVTP